LTDLATHSDFLRRFFSDQKLAVLATSEEGRPYLSLMAFAATADLRSLIVVTPKSSRKYRNLEGEARVALLVDDRTNQGSDFAGAVAVTALGEAEEAKDAQRGPLLDLYLAKHPQLREFATSPQAALIKVKVEKYLLVQKFQEILELPVAS
jgi:nitroimidazol reductase NimA-like FMN-containing flavoprotein (pyridoxamine 5'-phosphate oxidase superfamily)